MIQSKKLQWVHIFKVEAHYHIYCTITTFTASIFLLFSLALLFFFIFYTELLEDRAYKNTMDPNGFFSQQYKILKLFFLIKKNTLLISGLFLSSTNEAPEYSANPILLKTTITRVEILCCSAVLAAETLDKSNGRDLCYAA